MNLELLKPLGLSFVLSLLGMLFYRNGVLKGGYSLRNWINGDSAGSKNSIVTGAGILLLGVLCCWTSLDTMVLMVIGCMSAIGFIDDGFKLSVRFRLVAYAMGVFMVIFSMGATQNVVWWLLLVIFLLYLGFVNAVNFMDGINGLVPLQGIVILWGMLLSGRWIDSSMDLLVLLGWLIAFACFNLRERSALFLGDAGSIGLGFILFSLVLPKLMSGDFGVLMFFIVVGVDVVWVLCLRLYRRENIFERHEKHLYQKLVLHKFYSPVAVSVGYAIVQFGIIVLWEVLYEIGRGSEVVLGMILMLLFLAVLLMHRWIDESVDGERRG